MPVHFCRWKKLTFVFWHWITLVHHKNDVNTENCFQNGVRGRIWPIIITSHQFISGNLVHINRQRERDKVHKIHKNRDTQNTHIKQTEGHAEANTDKNRIKWRVLKLQRLHVAHTQFKFKSQKWATTRLLHTVHRCMNDAAALNHKSTIPRQSWMELRSLHPRLVTGEE